jgi:glycosyltransferase involved in cell wall biosynthesis
MNIMMVTNTYAPFVGGVPRSVQSFTDEYRGRDHHVLVVAPHFEGRPRQEKDVVRVPAIQRFNGSDFALPVPVPGLLSAALQTFSPQIVHSHHPYLLGDTALRLAASRRIPMVFTHHTMYERYTHYFPGHSPRYASFIRDLVIGYCNLCDAVVAPSDTVAKLLVKRGVEVRIEVIPTGVVMKEFSRGDGLGFRRRMGISPDVFLVGHTGRLAPEKNLGFLARAVARFLQKEKRARFLVVGQGPSMTEIEEIFAGHGMSSRLHFVGVLEGIDLAAAYASMDVFAFASQTETQGMVLTEAMAAGIPVVAVDAPGVREVMRDGENGCVLAHEDMDEFAAALLWISSIDPVAKKRLLKNVAATAEGFSMRRCSSRTLSLYESLLISPKPKEIETSLWTKTRRLIREEWKILETHFHAVGHTVQATSQNEET